MKIIELILACAAALLALLALFDVPAQARLLAGSAFLLAVVLIFQIAPHVH